MYCPKCGRKLSDNARFCSGCGYQLKNEPVPPPQPRPPRPPKPPKTRRRSWKPVAAAAAAVVVIAVIVGAFVLPKMNGDAKTLIWMTDDAFRMVKNIENENAESIKIGDTEDSDYYTGSNYGTITEDGKYFYFILDSDGLNGTGSLYRAELGKLSSNAERNENYIEKIASDVSIYQYKVLEDDGVVYISNERLYWYDGTESQLLASEAQYGPQVADDTVFYSVAENSTLYAKKLNGTEEAVRIGSQITEYYIYDAEHVVFTKDSTDENGDYAYSVYIGGYSVEPVKLTGNSSGVVGLYDYPEEGSFFFVEEEEESVPLEDLISYPERDADENNIISAGNTLTENDTLTESGMRYLTYTAIVAMAEYGGSTYDFQYDSYLNRYKSLYYYKNGMTEPQLICDRVDYYTSQSSSGVIAALYGKRLDAASVGTITIQELADTLDVDLMSQYFNDGDESGICTMVEEAADNLFCDRTSLYCTVNGGAEQVFSAEQFQTEFPVGYAELAISEDGGQLLAQFTSYGIDTYKYSALYAAPISGGRVGAWSILDDQPVRFLEQQTEGVLYYTDAGETVLYRDGKTITLEDGSEYYVQPQIYLDGTAAWMSDYNYETEAGTLKLLLPNKTEPQRIADDVAEYTLLDDGRVLYITEDGDLRLYENGESRKISSDVSACWIGCEKKKADNGTYGYWD